MKLNVQPLMEAIEVYIRKADDDLEQTLADEGYVAPVVAVAAINRIEDSIAGAYDKEVEELLKRIADAANIENFVEEIWPDIRDTSELKNVLEEIFSEEFTNLTKTFTANWILEEAPDLAVDDRITKPTSQFVENWSAELAKLMKLSSDEQMEKILEKGVSEHLSVQEVSQLISDSGIRAAGYQSRRVAVTEVLRIESYSQLEYMKQDPAVEKKEWFHTGAHKNEPRKNHVKISGQQVSVDEPFELAGRDGEKYYPMCPRDTCLPASESIHCHCIMKSIKNNSVLGMSAEERREMRQKYMDEVEAEWAQDHQSDKINVILGMEKPDQIRYFGGKKDGEARLALIQSGVIDTDEKLRKLYKTEKSGKMTLKSLQELAEDGIFTVSDTVLNHSTVGEFTSTNRLAKGGHSQACIDILDASGSDYTIVKTYQNGVRIGYVSNHKNGTKNGDTTKPGRKDADIGQAWFPPNWSDNDIRNAGTYIANRGSGTGNVKVGGYNGVRIGIFVDSDGKPTTIFPDNRKQINPNGGLEGARD